MRLHKKNFGFDGKWDFLPLVFFLSGNWELD